MADKRVYFFGRGKADNLGNKADIAYSFGWLASTTGKGD